MLSHKSQAQAGQGNQDAIKADIQSFIKVYGHYLYGLEQSELEAHIKKNELEIACSKIAKVCIRHSRYGRFLRANTLKWLCYVAELCLPNTTIINDLKDEIYTATEGSYRADAETLKNARLSLFNITYKHFQISKKYGDFELMLDSLLKLKSANQAFSASAQQQIISCYLACSRTFGKVSSFVVKSLESLIDDNPDRTHEVGALLSMGEADIETSNKLKARLQLIAKYRASHEAKEAELSDKLKASDLATLILCNDKYREYLSSRFRVLSYSLFEDLRETINAANQEQKEFSIKVHAQHIKHMLYEVIKLRKDQHVKYKSAVKDYYALQFVDAANKFKELADDVIKTAREPLTVIYAAHLYICAGDSYARTDRSRPAAYAAADEAYFAAHQHLIVQKVDTIKAVKSICQLSTGIADLAEDQLYKQHLGHLRFCFGSDVNAKFVKNYQPFADAFKAMAKENLILKHRDLWREVIESLAEIAVRKKDPKLTEFIISLLTHIKIQMLCHGSLKLSTSVIHSSMPREISLLTYTPSPIDINSKSFRALLADKIADCYDSLGDTQIKSSIEERKAAREIAAGTDIELDLQKKYLNTLMKAGDDSFAANNFESANKFYEEAYQIKPQVRILIARAKTYRRMNNIVDAVQCLLAAITKISQTQDAESATHAFEETFQLNAKLITGEHDQNRLVNGIIQLFAISSADEKSQSQIPAEKITAYINVLSAHAITLFEKRERAPLSDNYLFIIATMISKWQIRKSPELLRAIMQFFVNIRRYDLFAPLCLEYVSIPGNTSVKRAQLSKIPAHELTGEITKINKDLSDVESNVKNENGLISILEKSRETYKQDKPSQIYHDGVNEWINHFVNVDYLQRLSNTRIFALLSDLASQIHKHKNPLAIYAKRIIFEKLEQIPGVFPSVFCFMMLSQEIECAKPVVPPLGDIQVKLSSKILIDCRTAEGLDITRSQELLERYYSGSDIKEYFCNLLGDCKDNGALDKYLRESFKVANNSDTESKTIEYKEKASHTIFKKQAMAIIAREAAYKANILMMSAKNPQDRMAQFDKLSQLASSENLSSILYLANELKETNPDAAIYLYIKVCVLAADIDKAVERFQEPKAEVERFKFVAFININKEKSALAQWGLQLIGAVTEKKENVVAKIQSTHPEINADTIISAALRCGKLGNEKVLDDLNKKKYMALDRQAIVSIADSFRQLHGNDKLLDDLNKNKYIPFKRQVNESEIDSVIKAFDALVPDLKQDVRVSPALSSVPVGALSHGGMYGSSGLERKESVSPLARVSVAVQSAMP